MMVHSSKPAFNLNSGQYDEAAETASIPHFHHYSPNHHNIILGSVELQLLEQEFRARTEGGCSIMHKEKCLKGGPASVPVTASTSNNGDQPTSQ